MNKKALVLLGLLAFLFTSQVIPNLNSFSGFAIAQAPSSETIPESIYPCLPGARGALPKYALNKPPFLRGQVNYDGKQYYVVEMLFKTTPPFEDYKEKYYGWGRFFVSLDKMGCLALNTTDNATDLLFKSLTEIVPEPVARQLALQGWQKRLEQLGNTEKLKQEIIEGLQPGPYRTYLFKEDIWALNQLGVAIPESALNQNKK